MSTIQNALTAKLTSPSVPICPRREVTQVIYTAIVFAILIAVWSGLRLYARSLRQLSLNTEEALFFIAVCGFYGMLIALFIALYLGAVGYHITQLQPSHIEHLTQSVLVIQVLYSVSMCTAKWSILWMLKRIFDIPMFRVLTWLVIAVQAAWAVMTILVGILICHPIVKNWDPTAEGSCGNQIAGYSAVSIYNVIIDIVMCILPLPVIYRLNIKKPYRIALFAVFSIGIVTVIFSIIRLLSLSKINFDDFSYSVPDVITWTYAETGVVLLVACSPLLRPVFDKIFRRFLSQAHKSIHAPIDPSVYLQFNDHEDSVDIITIDRCYMRSASITVNNSDEMLELGQCSHSSAIASIGSTQELAPANGIGGPDTHLRSLSKVVIVGKTVTQTVESAKGRPNFV